MALKIVLADNQVMVRQGIRSLLEKEGFEIVGEASDGYEAIRLAKEVKPDIVIIEVVIPLLNGIDASQEISRVLPFTKVMLLTEHAGNHVVRALKAGIKGYILKSQPFMDLAQAIRDVAQGRIYMSPNVSQIMVDTLLNKSSEQDHGLSARERQTMQLVAEGKSTKEVAAILGISIKTAESHRFNLMRKLDIHETASLVRYAIREGLIQP